MKKVLAFLTAVVAAISMTACSAGDTANNGGSDGTPTLRIAYQYGMAYAPLQVMMEQKLIEKHYGKEVNVQWNQLNSGAAINEGLTGGSLDVGAMGMGPFISGVSTGLPYKMFSALSSQKHGIMTNDKSIQSLKDIKDGDQIALVNIGSFQHILLAMAAEKELGDAHALDGNIVGMAHPDGKAALEAGSVKLHLTSSPYIYQEEENDSLYEVKSLEDVWPDGNSFIVGVATKTLHDNNPELYNALVDAMAEAIDYLNNNKEEAAEMLCENEGVTKEKMLEYLNKDSCKYSADTVGVMDMANFMERAKFVDNAPDNYSDFVYDNVKGN